MIRVRVSFPRTNSPLSSTDNLHLEINLNQDLPREKTKHNQELQDKELELSDRLIAKIEAERDYFHTCIYSRY